MLQNGVPQFVGFCRCTPCRQRRGKGGEISGCETPADAPRAGSAEAKVPQPVVTITCCGMHPVQAAPRQSEQRVHNQSLGFDAPRAGSAEAKYLERQRLVVHLDAPRAGSAEAKPNSASAAFISADAPRAGSAEAKSRSMSM